MNASMDQLTPQFIEFIPKDLEPGVLYVSIEYTTTAHNCACGCGNKVVLPLHPTDWNLLFDGKSVTMRPSVGSWGFECRSHYLITKNKIQWANEWTEEQIEAGRRLDKRRSTIGRAPQNPSTLSSRVQTLPQQSEASWFRRLFTKIFR